MRLKKLKSDLRKLVSVCVDFRKYNEDDKEIYQYDINRKYSTEKIELHDKEIINMSYLVTAMVDTEEQVTDMEQ